jgi:hypothetical protein
VSNRFSGKVVIKEGWLWESVSVLCQMSSYRACRLISALNLVRLKLVIGILVGKVMREFVHQTNHALEFFVDVLDV